MSYQMTYFHCIIGDSATIGPIRTHLPSFLPWRSASYPLSRTREFQRHMSSSNVSTNPLTLLVLECQRSYREWQAADDQTQATDLRQQYSAHIENLWGMIEQDLLSIARGWLRSNMASDAHSLAMNMFTDVVDVLPYL